ncbi:MAG: transposase [Gemmatimonadetes bacterium]|nr:transposase [Gemmatimonadota bacterium]MBK6782297.1 transposase [Gemmatimonadota bacterium]MBK7351700.1 transposase [Gemmatimonadota bacterium]MBK7785259.1 transposase [Gemmatimonadota bacterium]MBK9067333.1 transposase [Gemmatimonadota bacterium]
MRHRLFAHVVWTTLDRAPILTAGVAEFLVRYLPAMAARDRARMLAVGIVATHLHLLLRLHPQTDIPRMIQRMKGGSARLALLEGHAGYLRWARGYNIESVSARALPAVAHYVAGQSRHHAELAIAGWEPPPPMLESRWREEAWPPASE